MSDTEKAGEAETEIDVTQAWQASNDQKSKAKKLRLMAGGSWFVAIATEIAAIVALKKNTFDSGGLVLLIGLLVVIAVFAICLLYTSPSPRDGLLSRMPSSA